MNEKETDKRPETGLYEFNFDEISVEGLEPQPQEKAPLKLEIPADPDEVDREEVLQEEIRKEKLGRKRARRKGWSASVGFLNWVKDLAIVIVIIWVLLMLAGFYEVKDTNMEPTLTVGEHVLIFKQSYRFTDPARGEMVAVRKSLPDEEAGEEELIELFISRIIGLPGDVIEINANGSIYVNDILFETSYCKGSTGFVYGELTYPYTVPEGCYFVLCDNPASTLDSRYNALRAVPKEQIEGKVLCVYWPKKSWRPVH
ncbi:MAG: signal peptidase I [Lachnospiraceae bacterium]|nr:signal peptidase I [Lachnospiraceae bacterium]